MKTQTITKNFYLFNELSEEQKQEVLDRHRGYDVDHFEWFEYTIDDYKEILEIIGFYDIDINFSGFWSQGDGASFTGKYYYEKG